VNYPEAWQLLDNLQFFKIKLGLESMTTFMERLGSPERGLSSIHIAGTNGKGSVAATTLAILTQAGLTVGVYTSPHLTSVRERFRINDEFIPEEDFARLATRIVDVLAGEQITYFEFTTALAFLWFAERQVDCAVIETGLGGRLDATNIITPRVSVITNIAMDHEAYLGTTLAEIAAEKAGIIKHRIPVVSGVLEPSAREVIRRTAESADAPVYVLGRDFSVNRIDRDGFAYRGILTTLNDLRLGLRGEHQVANAALALAGIELWLGAERRLDVDVVRQGLLAVRWPGRLEFFSELSWQGQGRAVLFDGAHNPAGVESLCQALGSEFHFEHLIMVWASMGDKDFQTCVARVAPLCCRMIFTRADAVRSATPEQLVDALPEEDRGKCSGAVSVEDALSQAYALAGEKDLICIAGSLYLIGHARGLLLGGLVGD